MLLPYRNTAWRVTYFDTPAAIARLNPHNTGNVRNREPISRNACCRAKTNKCYIFWICVCGLSGPTFNSAGATLCCHLWPVRFHSNFPHYLINYMIFWKKKVVSIFCTTFVWNISHSKKKWARYYDNCTHIGLHVRSSYSCQMLIKLWYSRRIPLDRFLLNFILETFRATCRET